MPMPTPRLAAIPLLALLAGACQTIPVVELSRGEIQAKIAPRFPLVEGNRLAKVELTNPRVLFESGSDRLGFELDAAAGLLGQSYAGSAAVMGRLRYEDGTFYFTEPELVRLSLPELAVEHQDTARRVINTAAAAMLPQIPLHTLQGSKERLAKMFIKRVEVRDEKIRVELGI